MVFEEESNPKGSSSVKQTTLDSLLEIQSEELRLMIFYVALIHTGLYLFVQVQNATKN